MVIVPPEAYENLGSPVTVPALYEELLKVGLPVILPPEALYDELLKVGLPIIVLLLRAVLLNVAKPEKTGIADGSIV